jgi:hypothetical protein
MWDSLQMIANLKAIAFAVGIVIFSKIIITLIKT